VCAQAGAGCRVRVQMCMRCKGKKLTAAHMSSGFCRHQGWGSALGAKSSRQSNVHGKAWKCNEQRKYRGAWKPGIGHQWLARGGTQGTNRTFEWESTWLPNPTNHTKLQAGMCSSSRSCSSSHQSWAHFLAGRPCKHPPCSLDAFWQVELHDDVWDLVLGF